MSPEIMTANTKFIIYTTHLNVTLYALCFWIQIGTLPYLTKKFGVNPLMFGYLQTTFATVQLLGGPIFGRFGDIFGSKLALMLAYLSSFLSYFLLGNASSILMIFLSRLPSIFMHAMHGAQMVITDLSDRRSRSSQLGKLGLSYGAGMVIGPVIGGLCTKYGSEQVAAYVAAGGSLASFALVCLFIPSNTKLLRHKRKVSAVNEEIPEKRTLFNIVEIIKLVLQNPTGRVLICVKIISGVPIGVLHSMFSVLALNHFNLSAEVNGYMLSYVGVLSMVSQGIIVDQITKQSYDELVIIKWSILALCASYILLLGAMTSVVFFCLALLPLVIAGAVFSTVLNGMLTQSVSSEDTGTVLGISMAVHSLIRSLAPILGGVLMENLGFSSFGLVGILFNAPLVIYLKHRQGI